MRPGRGQLFRVLVLTSCIAAPASADGYESAVTRGAAARDRALETRSERDWQEALELFAVAIELNPTQEAEFELAEAARALALEDEAYDAYTNALAVGLSGKAEERARAFVEAHAHTLGRLELRGPSGARVYVDQRRRGVLPLSRPLALAPGTRRVHVESTGLQPFAADTLIEADRTTTLDVTPVPLLIVAPRAELGRPVPQPSKDSARGAARPRWPVPALVGGAGLTVAGAATVIATSLWIDQTRDELRAVCAELRGDECVAATASHVSRAQALGNDLLALKGVRGVGAGAALLGAGVLTFSLITLAGSGGPGAPRRAAGLSCSGGTLEMTWRGEY